MTETPLDVERLARAMRTAAETNDMEDPTTVGHEKHVEWAQDIACAYAVLAQPSPEPEYAERLALADSFAAGLVAGVNAQPTTPDLRAARCVCGRLWPCPDAHYIANTEADRD